MPSKYTKIKPSFEAHGVRVLPFVFVGGSIRTAKNKGYYPDHIFEKKIQIELETMMQSHIDPTIYVYPRLVIPEIYKQPGEERYKSWYMPVGFLYEKGGIWHVVKYYKNDGQRLNVVCNWLETKGFNVEMIKEER